ncbi:hypothetical protein AS593_08450 [Caulobacter vibrioides]|nr:hypothetical protein AS593_08450 [Caulobacter vibrioides]
MPDVGERIFRRFAKLFGAACFVYAVVCAVQATLHDLGPDLVPDGGGFEKFLTFMALGYGLRLLARIDEKLDGLKAGGEG